MQKTINVLVLEDQPLDAELAMNILEEAGYICRWTRVESRQDFLAQLDDASYNLILADYHLPSFDGMSALRLCLEYRPDLPFILVSGAAGEELAIESLKAGATDYVLKDRLSRLVLVVERALREKEEQRQRQQVQLALEQEQRFIDLAIDSLPGIFYLFDDAGRFVRWNSHLETISGYLAIEISQMHPLDFFNGEDKQRVEQAIRIVFTEGEAVIEADFVAKDGYKTPYLFTGRRLVLEGKPYLVGTGIDISPRKAAEQELKHQKEILQTIFDQIPVMIAFFDRDNRLQLVNREWERVRGWLLEEVKGRADMLAKFYPDPDMRREVEAFMMAADRSWRNLETIRRDGRVIDTVWTNVKLSDGSRIGIGQDISDRKQMEAQLRQAQKMESIGRLAGGIAHDLNNLLVPIIGYTELTLSKLPQDGELWSDLMQVSKAAERAADLTRQILAFSRQQILEMRPLDLGQVIVEIEKILRRLIGEAIQVDIFNAPELGLVKADKAQIDQILINLAVNARDAMPDGGRLIIETANVFLDEEYATWWLELKSGPYVMLSMTDTGHGMDAATKSRLFEPFFTTKEQGKGTGLGLATVHGIIKQHQGHIWVYSEPGQGSIFKIYLPRIDEARPEATLIAPAQLAPGNGSETILVVEDDVTVRKITCQILSIHGYQVLEAKSGDEGLELAQKHQESIDLLLTDVIMPYMNGMMLYKALAAYSPSLKVLFMSGYSDNVITQQGIFEIKGHYLQKPFTIYGLTSKVREVLDS